MLDLFSRVYLLKSISGAVDGFYNCGVCGVGFDAFAELGNVLIEAAGVGEVVAAPSGVEEAVSVYYFAFVLVEVFEDGDVAWAEVVGFFIAVGAEFVGDDFQIVHGETVGFGLIF